MNFYREMSSFIKEHIRGGLKKFIFLENQIGVVMRGEKY